MKIRKGKQNGKTILRERAACSRENRAGKGSGKRRKKVEEAGIKERGGCAKDRRTICPEKRERNGRKVEREKRRLGSDTRRTKNLGREGEIRAGISGINTRGRTGQRRTVRVRFTRKGSEKPGRGEREEGKAYHRNEKAKAREKGAGEIAAGRKEK